MHLQVSLLASLVLTAPAMPGSSPGVALIAERQARARIVAEPQAGRVAAFAARELQAYIEKATGVRLPIQPQSSDDSTAEIILGAGPAARAAGLVVKDLPRDGFRIRASGHRVFIAGRDDLDLDLERNLDRQRLPVGREWATLFGAYEFLERYVGVRWYLPLDLGEVVPKISTLVVPLANLAQVPGKLYRDTGMECGADDILGPPPKAGEHLFVPDFKTAEEARAFQRRRNLWSLRLRYGTMRPPGSHTLWQIIHQARCLKDHPELFALGPGGERLANVDNPARSHHCFSHPGLISAVLDVARAFFAGRDPKSVGLKNWGGFGLEMPRGKVFHIAQDDGYRGCLCDRCQTFRKERMARGQSAEDIERELLLTFLKAVSHGVARDFPGALVSTSAYGPLARPPRERLPSNLVLLKLAVEGPYAEFLPEVLNHEQSMIRTWRREETLFFLPVPRGLSAGDPVTVKLALHAAHMEPGDQVWFDEVSLAYYLGVIQAR
jgi:hypothetical protein